MSKGTAWSVSLSLIAAAADAISNGCPGVAVPIPTFTPAVSL